MLLIQTPGGPHTIGTLGPSTDADTVPSPMTRIMPGHTGRGFMPENLSRKRYHLQLMGLPTPPGSVPLQGWAASLLSSGDPSVPLRFWGDTGARGKSSKGCWRCSASCGKAPHCLFFLLPIANKPIRITMIF